MKSSFVMRTGAPAALSAALLVSGCQLVVDFDRSRLDATMVDGGRVDSGTDAGPMDAGTDAFSGDGGPPCGDGVVLDGEEECDDGNTDADDGCDASCNVETGWDCNDADPTVCEPICGDTMTVGDEACDDGFNTACGVCNADCTAAGTGSTCGDDEICPDVEACDQGAADSPPSDGDGCSADCTTVETGWVCGGAPSVCAETCGNGTVDDLEECDDDFNEDGDGCSAACQIEDGWTCEEPVSVSVCTETCGDGLVVGDETCDDDMDTPEDDDGCSAACRAEAGWNCPTDGGVGGACTEICGDGMIVGDETCDDDMDTPENNDGCSTTCRIEDGWDCPSAGPTCVEVCGDGMVVGDEACDDFNTDACGRCSADCSAVQTDAATGTITVPAGTDLDDADPNFATVTINDGRTTPVTFEFDPADDGVTAGNTEVEVTGASTQNEVRDALIAAINGVPGLNAMAAEDGDGVVRVTNTALGVEGNQALARTDDDIVVDGMTGGQARDCAADVGCTSMDDCLSLTCSSDVCGSL